MSQYFKNKRIKGFIYSWLFSLITLAPSLTMAGDYQPITPNAPDFLRGGGGIDGLFSELFRWGVGLTVILAVVMLVIGGIQYMSTESVSGKSNGKEQIFAAIGGLLIALLSIFLLNIILGNGTGGGPFNSGS